MLIHEVKQISVVFNSNNHMFLSRRCRQNVDDFVQASMCQVYGDAKEIG